MAEGNNLKIVIRHTSGSKANSVQEFPWDGREEIKLGRDPASDVVYDSPRDDMVSRFHAAIRASADGQGGFVIEDLNSRNGTFLNKQKVEGRAEILPDDVVSLGAGGPSLTFDLQPRPANLVARTKIIDVAPAVTRLINATPTATAGTAFDATAVGAATTSQTQGISATGTQSGAAAAKETIGRNTMLHEIGKVRAEAEKEQQETKKQWLAAFAAVVLLAGAGGGYMIWKQSQDEKAALASARQARQEAVQIEKEAEDKNKETIESFQRQMGVGSLNIVREYGPATAKVDVHWRLFDARTDRPIFLKYLSHSDGKKYPMFIRYDNGLVMPVLTLDDENRTNIFIGEDLEGSAFGVDEKGFLLTNRHLAASWKHKYFTDNQQVLLFDFYNQPKKRKFSYYVVGLNDAIFNDIRNWIPERGGVIFNAKNFSIEGTGNIPDNSKNEQRQFYGKNESLTVKFAGSRLAMNATTARVSDENDVALLKVDVVDKINSVKTSDIPPTAGEKVVVIGYPQISSESFAVTKSVANGQVETTETLVPQPYVTEGIVAVVSNKINSNDGITTYGQEGDVMRLTINATGAGNSGGPVFNSSGEVIGIFSTSYRQGFATSSGAVPIKYGKQLFK